MVLLLVLSTRARRDWCSRRHPARLSRRRQHALHHFRPHALQHVRLVFLILLLRLEVAARSVLLIREEGFVVVEGFFVRGLHGERSMGAWRRRHCVCICVRVCTQQRGSQVDQGEQRAAGLQFPKRRRQHRGPVLACSGRSADSDGAADAERVAHATHAPPARGRGRRGRGESRSAPV